MRSRRAGAERAAGRPAARAALAEAPSSRTAVRGPAARAVQHVAADVEVGKQRQVLRHVADAAVVHGHVHAAPGIEQHVPADADHALVGPAQAGDGVQRGGLAGAGRAEQRHRARRDGLAQVESERAGAQADVDDDRRAVAAVHDGDPRRFER